MKPILMAMFALIFSLSASANVSDYETERLLFAKTAGEIEKTTRDASELSVAKSACALQTKLKVIPTFCIKAAAIEVRLGLRAKSVGEQDIARMNRTCVQAAKTAVGITSVQSALRVAELSPACRKALISREDELKYMEEARL